MPPWSFDPEIVWQPGEDALLVGLKERLWPSSAVQFSLPDDVEVWQAKLPFLSSHHLVCMMRPAGDKAKHCFLLHGTHTAVLDGSSSPIHAVNDAERTSLPAELRSGYLRFFCAFVNGEGGPFHIVVSPAEIRDPMEHGSNVGARQGVLDNLRHHARPLIGAVDRSGNSQFEVLMIYGKSAFIAKMSVSQNALVEMVDDDLIEESVPTSALPVAPKLFELYTFLPELAKAYRKAGILPKRVRRSQPGPSANAEEQEPQRVLDGDITRLYVRTLLSEALKKQKRHTLLDRFNSDSQDGIARFSRFVLSAWPVVAIETDVPFAEEMIAEIVGSYAGSGHVETVAAESNRDDGMLHIKIPGRKHQIVLIPLNSYRGLLDVELVAHQIAIGETAAMISCHRFTDLPDPLRKSIDMVLTLPDLDHESFRDLFQAVFAHSVPAGWRRGDSLWVRYLLPTDLHQPAKLGLRGMEIIRYLRERVEERLRLVAPISGPALEDLHGLIEAKQVAHDLIADIAAARQGRIGWTAVDRGMLLVGPPGTGKTSLARAIAKSCGVRFVSASAAAWQSAGHLGDHLRAMRASFTEARRYAPSILFIDEIDSIGSRESFAGDNSQYHAQVINGLLELLQGLDEAAPVIVLAATNYAERVDPALRRAGRLDRTVTIPYPNVDALTAIFEYYLADRRTVPSLAGDIDVKALGAMAFGLTGADIESFVRGAARRARKEDRPVTQADLLAEVTGKPRHKEGAGRLTTREMRTVAVHEAGHALARALGRDGFDGIAYVSIVPRGDGALGFVASTPSSYRLLDREQYHDHIEVVLAGRAAEELVFGEMGITGGAGGASARSDLALATQMATELICHLGMSKSGGLVWSIKPDSDQQQEVASLLKERYSAVVQRLCIHRQSLDALVDALIQQQELTGGELREIIEPLLPSTPSCST